MQIIVNMINARTHSMDAEIAIPRLHICCCVISIYPFAEDPVRMSARRYRKHTVRLDYLGRGIGRGYVIAVCKNR